MTVDREDELATGTTTADKDLERALENTRRNSQGSGPLPPPVPPGTETMKAPYNPFARTLATSEASLGLQKAAGADEQAERNRQGAPKMNVDMFKNILMTGSADPSRPVAPDAQAPHRPQESSNSMDTYSLSQQSDLAHGSHAESPRSSFDQRLESDSEEEDHNEHSSLMGPVATRPEAEGPPPPPKHKHGKALAARGPQTVSFADFNNSISQGWQTPEGPRTPPPQASPRGGILQPPSPRSPPSDLNKPLPPPPEARANTGLARPSTESAERPTPAGPPPFSPAREEPPAKKAPPPPPASRRQAPASAGRARSGSNLTQNSIQEEDESSPIPRIAPPPSKPAPPPPPARRGNNSVAAQPSPAVETPPVTETPPTLASSENKPIPPPPPRRTHSKTASITRTSSNASRTSIPRSGDNAPPAPPPRRGAGSGRNSLEGASRRLSGQDYRRTSGQSDASSLQQVDEGEAPQQPPQRDMLADLAALQAEVDALRAKAGQG